MVAAVYDVRDTLGALLIGVLIACCLFGIITVQTFTYYTRFPNDKLHLKAIVRLFPAFRWSTVLKDVAGSHTLVSVIRL